MVLAGPGQDGKTQVFRPLKNVLVATRPPSSGEVTRDTFTC